jgi:hypothetical protein
MKVRPSIKARCEPSVGGGLAGPLRTLAQGRVVGGKTTLRGVNPREWTR